MTARVAGRHPDWEDEDMLELMAGPDIGYTDRRIRINPFGAFTTEREGQEVYANADRYLIATAVHEREWIVEAAIPLNALACAVSMGTSGLIASTRSAPASIATDACTVWRKAPSTKYLPLIATGG